MADSALRPERESFKSLTLKTNRAWKFSIEELQILFPFGFDFARVFEEVLMLYLIIVVQVWPFVVHSQFSL